MNTEINFTNFKPEDNLKRYIIRNYNENLTKVNNLNNLKLSYTRIDNQGYVVNLSGKLSGKEIKNWWTGLSLYYCTEKIFEDFFKKVMIKNEVKAKSIVAKNMNMDSFGFPKSS